MDPRVVELHCIMPIANISSVAANGILSYEAAAKLQHHSIALQPVQDKRNQKQVPGGLNCISTPTCIFTREILCCSNEKLKLRIFAFFKSQPACCRLKARSFRIRMRQATTCGFCIPRNGSFWILTLSSHWIGGTRAIRLRIGGTARRNVRKSSCRIECRQATFSVPTWLMRRHAKSCLPQVLRNQLL